MPNFLSWRREDPRLPAVIDWDPVRLVRGQLRRIQNLLRLDPYTGLFDREPLGVGVEVPTGYTPDFDVHEDENTYVITADLPGVRIEDVDIDVTGRRLRIRGKRESERKEEGESWYAAERSFGSFVRTFTLPEGVDVDDIHADLTDGVLTVRVPKLAGAAARRIEVTGAVRQLEKEQAAPQAEKVAEEEKVGV